MTEEIKGNGEDKVEAKQEGKRVRLLLSIGVLDDGKVVIEGALSDKKLCLRALGEAVKIMASYEESKIIKPKGSFLGGIRNMGRKH